MIYEGEQRTPEWDALRLARITASTITDLMATVKTGVAAGRKKLEATKIAEIMTGLAGAVGYVNTAIEWGIEQEVNAVGAYEAVKDVLVRSVMFATHPTQSRAGASPDGLVGDDGMIEVKCPETHTHIEYALAGVVPRKYYAQIQWGMACCEREWADFISFDPRLPGNCQLFIARVLRNDEYVAKVEREIGLAFRTIDATIAKLEAM